MSSEKKHKKIIFPQMKDVEYIENNGFLFQWCCDCHLRHIWHFKILRGKTPDKDFIEISGARDDIATKLRREKK